MAFIENGDIEMLEGFQLQTLCDELWHKEEALMVSKGGKYYRDCKGAHNEVSTLLAKCKNFNSKINQGCLIDVTDKSMEENKNVNADAQEDTSENLKHVDIIMSHVRNWCTRGGWKGLLEYLELETKEFSKKCIKFQKRYTIAYQEGADGINKDVKVEMKQHYGITEFDKDIQEYITYAINVGLQCARNCGARSRWISKIEMHIEMLKQVLQDQNGGNLQGMAEHMYSYKKYMLEFAKHCQKGSIQTDSVAYNTLLQKEHEQFSDMATKRKMKELGLAGEFDNLTDSEKLKVWCGIINESTSSAFKSESSGVASHCLLIEFIFGKGDDTKKEFTHPTFLGANMPNGMRLARDIAAKKKKDKKKEDH